VSSPKDTRSQENTTAIADATTVHVAEYQALRQEVNNRQTLSNALIAADLTALGVGISTSHSFPTVLVALAVVSSLLWLFWLVQTLQIYRIAAYIALELRPRLAEMYQCSLLDWESYVRRLTFSRESAALALYGATDAPKMRNFSRNKDGVYISLLLGGATPLLLASAAIVNLHHNSRGIPWKLEIAASLALWLYALIKAIVTLHTTNVITEQIINSQEPPAA